MQPGMTRASEGGNDVALSGCPAVPYSLNVAARRRNALLQ